MSALPGRPPRRISHVNRKGPETLPDLVATLVYVTRAPFLEAEEAYGVAMG